MWIKDWIDDVEPEVVAWLRNRISHYPILHPARELLAGMAVHRTKDTRHYLSKCDDEKYFKNKRQFGLWFRELAYREAVRQAFLLPASLDELRQFKNSDRQTLYFLYLDQFTIREIAKPLELVSVAGPVNDDRKVGMVVAMVVREWLEKVQRRYPVTDGITFATSFPLPPLIPRSVFN